MPAHPSRRDALATGAAALSAPAITTDAAADDDTDATQGLSFPGTTLVRKVRDFVDEAAQPYLRNHSLRAFLFGRAAAAQAGRRPGKDYDEEVLFLICALHDMGLTACTPSTPASEGLATSAKPWRPAASPTRPRPRR
ncbi:hypothetical protein [Streptomyces nigrescens]